MLLIPRSATPVEGEAPAAAVIVDRSVAANDRDWQAAPDFNYFETDRTGDQTKTYEVAMIYGSPYNRLVSVNGVRLSGNAEREEQSKMDEATRERRRESESQRTRRIEKYKKDRERDHLMMSQLTKAFHFRFHGGQQVDGYDTYVLDATPRAGYQPPNFETEALTGMAGRLWIDKKTFQWVKVEAHVTRPVSIAGFLAEVEPGTRFELENRPVAPGIWLASLFTMRSRSRILFLFPHRTGADETYFGYSQKTGGHGKP